MFHHFVYSFLLSLQMSGFKTAPDFSTSIGSLSERKDPNQLAVSTSGYNQGIFFNLRNNIFFDKKK